LIIVVDRRAEVLAAYTRGFGTEGVAATDLEPDDFSSWLNSSDGSDILAVEVFLLGDHPRREQWPPAIRAKSSAPVIALNDSRQLEQTISILAAGADDVVGKPVHVREILARANAIRRRSACHHDASCGDIRVHGDGRDPVVGGSALSLPRRERRILEYLSINCNRWVSREQLYAAVYGMDDQEATDSAIESHISRLRSKLRGRLGLDPIEGRRFQGYKLNCKRLARGEAARTQASGGQVSLSL
jgi:two-component system, OmpR family, flagellar system response regulator FtcR